MRLGANRVLWSMTGLLILGSLPARCMGSEKAHVPGGARVADARVDLGCADPNALAMGISARKPTAPATLDAIQDTLPPLENRWWDGFYLKRGFDNSVRALIEYRGNLIATGPFTLNGLTAVDHIASWDGQAWSALGAGVGDSPRVLAVYNDTLIVPDGNRVKAWTGSIWRDLAAPTSTSDRVLDLQVHSGRLVVSFLNSGIRWWDGSSWSAATLPGGLSPSRVNSFATYHGDLIAAGRFSDIGGVPANSIARWDGSSWNALGTGIQAGGREVDDLTVYADSLVVSGSYNIAGDRPATGLASWDGASWRSLPGLRAPQLLVHDGTLYGIRDLQLLRWAGTGWTALPGSLSAWTLGVFQNKIVIGAGPSQLPDGTPFYDVATYDGTWWTWLSPIAGSGLNGPVRAQAVYGDTLVVSGDFNAGGAVPVGRTARWDGSSWRPFSSEGYDRATCLTIYNGDLIAAGNFRIGGNPQDYCVARWDGASWHVLGSTLGGRIDALVVYDGTLVAAGVFAVFNGGIVRWDGTGWAPLGPPPGPVGIVASVLAVHNGKLIAASAPRSDGFLSSWDGQAWTPLETARGANDLIVQNGQLLAAGIRFTTSYNLMRWDGTHWLYVPSPLSGKLWVYGSNLGEGDFIQQGNTWARLGPGVRGIIYAASIYAASTYKGSLYLGGAFTNAGGHKSLYIARWDGGVTPVEVEDLSVNSDESAVHLRWRLSSQACRELSGLRVQRAESVEGPYLEIGARPLAPARDMSYADTPAARGRRYWYRLVLQLADGAESTAGPISIDFAASKPGTVLYVPYDLANGSVQIRYDIGGHDVSTRVAVYDCRGRNVCTLENAILGSGQYVQTWDRRNAAGERVPRGIYFVHLTAGGTQATRKLVLLHG